VTGMRGAPRAHTGRASWLAAARLVLGAIAAAVALTAWALTGPVGAAPDDDFHLASLWCAPTASADFCEPLPDGERGEVRLAVAGGSRCFVIDEAASGACTREALRDDRRAVTDRANFAVYNPQGFYTLLGPLAGEDIEASVLAVRLVGAGVFLALVISAFLLLPPARRPALVWGVLLTIVPAGLDLIPSTNPQSWAFGAAAVTALALLGATETRGPRRLALGGLAIVATAIAVAARADAAAVALLAVGVVLILRLRPDRRAWLLLAGLALVAGLGVTGLLTTGQGDYVLPRSGGYGPELLGLALTDALAMPILWYRVLAGPVGWQDVPLSPAVGIIIGLLVLAATIAAFRAGDRRMRWALALVIAVLWLLPLYLLVNNGSLVGMYVQPRYLAPIVMLLGTLLPLRGAATLRLPGWAAWSIAGALAVAHAAALHGVIRRYATGTDVTGFDLDAGAEWSSPMGPSPMTLWWIGSLAWALLLAAAAPLLAAQKRTSTSEASCAGG